MIIMKTPFFLLRGLYSTKFRWSSNLNIPIEKDGWDLHFVFVKEILCITQKMHNLWPEEFRNLNFLLHVFGYFIYVLFV